LPTGIASEPAQGVHLEGQRRPIGASLGEAEEGEPRISKEVGLKEIVRETTARLERDLILNALAQTMGNVTQAAKLLKISRKSLQLKMKELGLREASKEDSKEDSGKGSG
ncbi:MAG: hypothetical protein N2515_11450, partial [Deltaproteobacteria bacterium]|nr:hypothetical protein [Deltaproteobacteria bacterium]